MGYSIQDSEFRVYRAWGLGFRVKGSGFLNLGYGFWIMELGFRRVLVVGMKV